MQRLASQILLLTYKNMAFKESQQVGLKRIQFLTNPFRGKAAEALREKSRKQKAQTAPSKFPKKLYLSLKLSPEDALKATKAFFGIGKTQ